MKKAQLRLRTATRRPTSSVRRFIALASGCLSLASLAACSATVPLERDRDIITWEQYRAQAAKGPDVGSFVVEGDLYARDETELRAIYDRWLTDELRLRAARREDGLGRSQEPLVQFSVGGIGARWDDVAALDLSYCIVRSGFDRDQYGRLIFAIDAARNDWEATGAAIAFRHAYELDATCTSSSDVRIIFVASHGGGTTLAATSLGLTAPLRRLVSIAVDDRAFKSSSIPLAGVIRHELGHALGFAHEHSRRPSSGCEPFQSEVKELTPIDYSSVMYYNFCPGSSGSANKLSDGDIRGVRIAYGARALTNIVIAGGTGSRTMLSTNGSNADLWTTDDGSGRQRWFIKKVDPDKYNIVLANGAGYLRYLSTTPRGETVDLWDTDDGSGRQQWGFEYGGAPGLMHIFIQGGTAGDRRYLSATRDGAKVDLWASDDGSGRQRWKLNTVGGGTTAP